MFATYGLTQFILANGDKVVTRGRNDKECRYFLETILESEVVCALDYCPINAGYLYSCSHPFNWLEKTPRWLNPNTPFEPINYKFRDRFYRGNVFSCY